MTAASHSAEWLRRRLDLTPRQVLALLGILAIALILRVIWVTYAARTPQDFHDPLFYIFYANQIAEGNGYRIPDGTPTAYYPIGYAATLAGVFFLIKHTFIPDNFTLAAAYFQIFLGLVTVALAFYVGRRLFGVTVGLLAAAWLALFPNLIYHTGTYLTETLFNTLVMAVLAVLVGSTWPKGELTRGRLIAAGVLLGAASLVRPIALLLLPLLIVAWLIGGARWQRAGLQVGIVAVVTFAVIMPWSIRNFVVMDSPILISANLGDDLCMGHHPGARGHFALPDHCFAGYDQYVRPEFEVRRNDENTRKAIRFAVDNPRAEIKLLFLKARWTYEHDHDGLWAVESYGDDPFIDPTLRTALARTADIYFFTTISIGGVGLIGLLVARRDPRHTFLVLATLAFGAVPLAFFGDSRFHVPAMPLLVFAAAWAVVTAFNGAPRLLMRSTRARELPGSGIEISEGERAVAEQDALQDA